MSWLYLTPSVFLRAAYEGGLVFLLFSCNYLTLNCSDAGLQQWRKVMARHPQQMLIAEGSSPAGDAAKASTKGRSSMCTCKLSRKPKNSSSPGSWVSLQADCGKGSTVVEVSLQRQAIRSECKLRPSDHWVPGLVSQGVPGNGTQKSKWR